MKLIELDPRWCIAAEYIDANGTICRISNDPNHGRHGMGMTFNCPVHKNHRLAVMFAIPLDRKPPDNNAKHLWLRTGETFDTISIHPSINASVDVPGCWHGFITNGEIL